ncbi:MAG: 30S ribosomal protein S6 [Cytophagaceae bacterium]
MEVKNYETVFILTPVLSDTQMKDTVEKFRNVLKENGAELVNDENWGLKKLAYPINHKTTGFYHLFEFKGSSNIIKSLEIEYKRDERIMRFLSTVLDKHAFEYNIKRKKGEFKKSTEKQEEKA